MLNHQASHYHFFTVLAALQIASFAPWSLLTEGELMIVSLVSKGIPSVCLGFL